MSRDKRTKILGKRARSHRRWPCATCRKLTLLHCDYPLPDWSGNTCCRPVCAQCATKHEHRNYCPTHARMYADRLHVHLGGATEGQATSPVQPAHEASAHTEGNAHV